MHKKLLILICGLFAAVCFWNCAGTGTQKTNKQLANVNEKIKEVEIFPQLGHIGSVNSVAFSPDGKYVLTGSSDNTIKLWEVESGREIRTFLGHTKSVYSVAFSPDGKYVLTGSSDNTIKLWEIESGREIRTFSGHTKSVYSVAFSPDGKQILSGSVDNTIKLWDVTNGLELRTFSGYGDNINSVAFSPDGKQILSGSTGYNSKKENSYSEVKLWDIASGREIRTFSVGRGFVAFSPDGKQVLSGSDSQVILWDAVSGQEIRTFKESLDIGSITSIAFSNDGKKILAGFGSSFGSTNTTSSRVILWDASSGQRIKTFYGYTRTVTSAVFSPDSNYIISGFEDGTAKLWDVANNTSNVIPVMLYEREIRTFSGHTSNVNSVVFSPDGRRALSGYDDGTVKLWDMASGREVAYFSRSHASNIVSKESNFRFFGGMLYSAFLKDNRITSVAFSPDGKQALSGSNDRTVKLWDVASEELRTFSGHKKPVNSVAFSPDGKQALSGSDDQMVKLWDVSSGREIRTFEHPSIVTSVAFNYDGKKILTSSLGKIILWDVASGLEINTIESDFLYKTSLALSPDDKQILHSKYSFSSSTKDNTIIFSKDYTIKLRDVETGKEIRTFSGHTDEINSVAFSPDGRQALSCSLDKTIKLWDVASGREIRTISGHISAVNSVAFNHDGSRIISGSDDGTTRVWDTATGAEIAKFISIEDDEWVCVTPEGYYNASPQGDKYLNIRIGNNVYGIDQYRETFFDSTMVALALSSNRDAYLAEVKLRGKTMQDTSSAPPLVAITSPATGATANSAATKISVSVDSKNRSIEYITVKVNGKMVARDYGVTPTGAKSLTTMARLAVLADKNVNKKQASFNLDIPLEPGNNIIEVFAYNGYGEGRAVTEVAYRTNQTNLPTLYILSIGVSKYADKSIESLKYAANDAKGIVQAFRAQEGKRYGAVKSLVLADGGDKEPTRDNISDGMDFLRGAGHNDVMMLFLSGHGGTDDQGNFFFMPTNMTFNANGTPQRSRIIPNNELQEVLRFPGQKIVFIDSCYSGGVNNDVLVNGLNLVRDGAPVIFTSSSKTEKSWEHDPAKLSLFTYVLLEGLSGSADADKNKKITVQELGEYVKKAVPGIRDNQHPYYLAPDGYRDFVVAETK